MTSHILSQAASLGAASTGQGAGLIERFVAAVRAWRLRMQTANQLSRLSDRMLDDIGLTRSDVDSYIAGRSPL